MNTRALSRLLPLSRSISLSPVRSFSIKRRRLMTAPPPPGKFPAYYTRYHKPARPPAPCLLSMQGTRQVKTPTPPPQLHSPRYNRIPEYKVKPMELMSKWREGWRKLDLGVKSIRCRVSKGAAPIQPSPSQHDFQGFLSRPPRIAYYHDSASSREVL